MALVPKRDLGVTGGRVKKAETGPEERCGRVPEDKVPFPEVVLLVVVKGVGSPAFLGDLCRKTALHQGWVCGICALVLWCRFPRGGDALCWRAM